MSPAEEMIRRFGAVFGEPRTDDPELFLREYAQAVSGWDAAILKRVGDRLVRQAKYWPRPAEVCELAEALVADMPRPSRALAGANTDWTQDALRTADRLIAGEMGRQAAREGWITQLHDYCRRHRQLPDERAVPGLEREARLFEEAFSACCTGNGGALSGALRSLGESMLAKRDRMAAMAAGPAGGLTARSRAMTGEHAQ